MAEEFEQAMATAEMPPEEAEAAEETAAEFTEAQTAETAADPAAAEAQEQAVGYDVDIDYNMEWEVETEPAEPAEPDVTAGGPQREYYEDRYYDERMSRARRRYNKHLFVWVFNFVCGMYGVDRIVRGQVALGVLKLLTFGGLGMWYLGDLIIALVKAYSGEYMNDEDVYFDALGRYV